MIGKILQKLVDDKLTSVKEIGVLTGAAPSTVYRWIRGESEPSFDSIRLLIRHVPEPRAQAELLAA
ncbi:MAG: helix-turn-helix transcriptional regulator, partial [Phycisphaeraceae bacterium]|nr:helix-turn-helix transcriptional regulator [Phycisphaeraceae bacterium]